MLNCAYNEDKMRTMRVKLYLEFYYVSILDDTIFTFSAKQAQLAGFGPRTGFQKFFPINHLRTYEFIFKIGVNGSARSRRPGAERNCPSPRLILSRGKKSYKTQHFV